MRRLFWLLALVAATWVSMGDGKAQPSSDIARHIGWGASLPAGCNPSTGDVFFKTTATVGPYYCDTPNHWTAIHSTGGGATIAHTLAPIVGDNAGNGVAGKNDTVDAIVFCADAGSTDDYACNLSPAITAYVTGTHYRFKANTANTGAATIAFNSLASPKTIVKVAGGITTALADNDIRVGQWVDIVYDGTNMQLQSTLGNAAASVTCPAGSDGYIQFYISAGLCGGDSNLTWDNTTKTLAVGASNPTLSVNSTTRLSTFGQSDVDFDPITIPGAPTVALAGAGAGNVDNGTHVYTVTYVTALRESAVGILSSAVTVIDNSADGQVNVSAIPVSNDALVLTKNIYRTRAGFDTCFSPYGSGYQQAGCFFLGNIPNATTSFIDNLADPAASSTSRAHWGDSTAGAVYAGGVQVGKWDAALGLKLSRLTLDSTVNGIYATNQTGEQIPVFQFSNPSGSGWNFFIGPRLGNATLTGKNNFILASDGGQGKSLTSGSRNVGLITAGMSLLTSGNDNAVMGAGASVVGAASSNVVIGGAANANNFSETVSIGFESQTQADGSVAIGRGIINAIANSVRIGTNSTPYFDLPGVVGSAGQASCWKTTTQLSYCEDVVGVTGACTCH